MKELMDLIKKKKEMQGEMSPEQKKAKMGILGELRDIANGEIGRELPSLKKVTVASNSKEGLQEGLQKAESMLGKEEGSDEEEKIETPEEEKKEGMEGEMAEEMVSPQEMMDIVKHYSPEEKAKLLEMLKNG